MNTQKVLVAKATGEKEPFSEEKLRNSIKRAGVPKKYHDKAASYVKNKLYPNIETKKIYKYILEFLNKTYPYGIGKYKLKKAIMSLGPTGYPFEKFVAKLLDHKGYSVKIDSILKGACVDHEIDIIAIKNNKHFIIECKYHHRSGIKTNVKTALYVKSRFDDVLKNLKKGIDSHTLHQAWLVTNTKCTSNAIKYSECVGMKVIAWEYPKKGSLQQLIETAKLYPITCLTSLTDNQKRKLLDHDLIFCQELTNVSANLLRAIGIDKESKITLKREIEMLCGK